MEPLTEKQRKILDFVVWRLNSGSPPSQRDIAAHFGLAQNSVYQLIGYIKNKGYLTDSGGHRSLRLSKQYQKQIIARQAIPILGSVAAGEPILAQENIDQRVNIDELLDVKDNIFILRISGDSMVDEGILDGDFVLVQPGRQIENGQIAVVLLDDEATVKTVYFQKNRIALKPANSAAGYKTRYIKKAEKDIRIIGKVTGCVRKI